MAGQGEDEAWRIPVTELVGCVGGGDRAEAAQGLVVLGCGSQGEVHVASWAGAPVAVKWLHPNAGPDDVECRLAVEEEVKSRCRRYHHPHIVQTLGGVFTDTTATAASTLMGSRGDEDAGAPQQEPPQQQSEEKSSRWGIVSELLEGSLEQFLLDLQQQEQHVRPYEVIELAVQIVRGVRFLHESIGQPHRNLSARNVLFGAAGAVQVKLADPGFAAKELLPWTRRYRAKATASRSGLDPLESCYVAPELRSGRCTVQTDMFAVGVLLMELCTSRVCEPNAMDEQMERACERFPPLDAVLRRCLSPHPVERPSAADVAGVLERIKLDDRFYPIGLSQLEPRAVRVVTAAAADSSARPRASTTSATISHELPADLVLRSGISVHAAREVEQHIDKACASLEKQRQVALERLQVEQERWHEEAHERDAAERRRLESESKTTELDANLQQLQQDNQALQDHIEQLKQQAHQQTLENRKLLTELEQSQAQHQQDMAFAQEQDAEIARLNALVDELENKNQETLMNAQMAVERQEYARESQQEAVSSMKAQEGIAQEAEARLDQALARWQQEKREKEEIEALLRKTNKVNKKVIAESQEAQEQMREMASRMRLYDALPVPEEITQRFNRSERVEAELSEAVSQLEAENSELQEAVSRLSADNTRLEKTLDETVRARRAETEHLQNELTTLRERSDAELSNLRQALDEKQTLAAELQDLTHRQEDQLREQADKLETQGDELQALRALRVAMAGDAAEELERKRAAAARAARTPTDIAQAAAAEQRQQARDAVNTGATDSEDGAEKRDEALETANLNANTDVNADGGGDGDVLESKEDMKRDAPNVEPLPEAFAPLCDAGNTGSGEAVYKALTALMRDVGDPHKLPGARLVAQQMAAHSDHPNVQLAGLRFFCAAVKRLPEACAATVLDAGIAGAITNVTRAGHHKNNALVACDICRAVRGVGAISEMTCQDLIDQDTVAAVIAIMNLHETEADMQAAACAALDTLVNKCNAAQRRAIRGLGATEAARAAMDRFSDADEDLGAQAQNIIAKLLR